jgi:hypothetical protein
MKEAIDKVRRALSRQGIIDHLTYYLVKDNYICASDGRVTAGTPFPCEHTFLVPGGEFEKIVDHFESDTITLEMVDTNKLLLKAGRMRATMETLPFDLAHYPEPDGFWLGPPEGFVDFLKKIRPFVSENATRQYALCVCLRSGRMLATTNVCLVEVQCPSLLCNETLLPCWAVDFILSHPANLTGMIFNENNMSFCWDDQSWMVTQLVEGGFPPNCDVLLDKGPSPEWEITDEWRTAFNNLSHLCDGEVVFHPDRMVGKTERSVVEYAVASPTEGSKWEQKFLAPVVEVATHWAITAWPAPAPFKGAGIRGLIVGRI